MDKVLVFDIFGDYAFFKKNYTTLSPLSFSIPPKTVLIGIIGAMMGVDKKINPEKFGNSFIALKIINPIKKTRIPINLLKTISRTHFYNFEQHKPTNIEFLKDVRFRIYFHDDDTGIYQNFYEMLKFHKTIYTISLGISELLGDYEFIGEKQIEKKETEKAEYVPIESVFPKNIAQAVEFQKSCIYSITLPNKMLNTREIVEFKEFLFESEGAPIHVKLNTYFKVGEGAHEEIVVPM